MRSTEKAILRASMLALAIGCGSAGDDRQEYGPTQPGLPPAAVPPTTQPAVPTAPHTSVPEVWLGGQIREAMVGEHFLLVGSAFSDVANAPLANDTMVAIAWRTDDGGAVSIEALDKRRLRVRGEHAGTGWIEGTAFGTTTHVYLTVLGAADTSAVTPVVIDDFRVYEHRRRHGGELTYSPQITLHDSTPSGGAALIAVSVEIPGLEPTPPCAMLRPIGAAPMRTFSYESYFQDFEYNIRQPGRSSTGAVAVAHLIIRLPNRTAMRSTVSGPIVTESQLPEDDYFPSEGDYLSCE